MSFEAVIFDMDGVLVDSEPLHFATTNQVLGRRGARLSPERYAGLMGLTDRALFERLADELGLPEPPGALARERLQASLQAMAEGPLLPTDGALECLLWLRAEGYRLALASSSVRAQVDVVMERLGLRGVLQASVAAEDAPRGKPAPDLFLEAARRLGCAPRACLVVEDAVLGVAAAVAAGMAAVALIPAGGDGRAHRAAGAVACLVSLRELDDDLLVQIAERRPPES